MLKKVIKSSQTHICHLPSKLSLKNKSALFYASSSSFFSSVGCADDEALTRLIQTSVLFVFLVAYQSWYTVFGYFSPSGPP